MTPNHRELAAIVAGLRLIQFLRDTSGIPPAVRAVLTDRDRVRALTDSEIDGLVDRLNAAGEVAHDRPA